MKSYLIILLCALLSCCQHPNSNEHDIENTYIGYVGIHKKIMAEDVQGLSELERIGLYGAYTGSQFDFYCAAKPLSALGLVKFTKFYSQMVERHGSVDVSAETMFMRVKSANCQ